MLEKVESFIVLSLTITLSFLFSTLLKAKTTLDSTAGIIAISSDKCVNVPENHLSPNGTQITLCYKWLRPYDKTKKTFFFLVGGPGAGFDYYMLFSDFWLSTKLGKNFNLLFFDPRGVGRSSEVNAKNLESRDMRQYTLTNMTMDVEFLRRSLLGLSDPSNSAEKIGLIGHSTGGHQVFDYAIRFPNHVFSVISLHGGSSALGFLTQAYYRMLEWQNASAMIDQKKLENLQHLIQSGHACESNGRLLPTTSWTQLMSFALYGTVSQRKILPDLLSSLVQGNVDSKYYCEHPLKDKNSKGTIPTPPTNDPLNAMSKVNLIINENVVCSNFLTEAAVRSLSSPFHDPCYRLLWAPLCLPRLTAGQITEEPFDVRRNISKIRSPILIVGGDSDQWIPFNVQKEVWQNMTDFQKAKSGIYELSQCGHFSFYECPNQLKLILDHFVNRL